MKLYDTYRKLVSEQIDIDQAAEEFGLTTRDLRFRMTRHGKRLALILRTLDKVRGDTITREEAAEALGVTARQVNNLMSHWHIERPLKSYLVTRATSAIKWEIRKKYAIDYIAGSSDIVDAAEAAGVSDRQMRRWVSELLGKHFGMVFKDLKSLPNHKLKRLADEIETAEGLEVSRLKAVEEVAEGRREIKDLALEMVMSKRTRGGSGSVRRN